MVMKMCVLIISKTTVLVSDVPYYSMHLCNLNEKIFDIIENNNVHTNERNLVEIYSMDFQLICKSLFLDCNCEGN
jgi:hypothetical protein